MKGMHFSTKNAHLLNFLRFDVKLVVSYWSTHDHYGSFTLATLGSETVGDSDSHLGRRDNKGVIALNYANENTANTYSIYKAAIIAKI